ncbi:MAG: amidohydrolase family protein [Planctomycetota bacterium]|jgi:imidazolonepropionase-like amidohydrolase
MKSATLLTLSLLASLSTLAAQDQVTVLRGATILTGKGPAIENGVMVISSGKIQSVGDSQSSIPQGARVIDCNGLTMTPGLVDAGTMLGLDRMNANEQGEEITPQMKVIDALDPADPRFDRIRSQGVTTVQVNPGNRNVIGGLGAVVKTSGTTVGEMLLRDESGMRLTMGSEASVGNRAIRGGLPDNMYYRRPTTRMGVIWAARKAFYDAIDYREQKTIADGDDDSLGIDPGMEVLVKVLDRKVTVHTTAHAEQDIRTALRLSAEFGYETLLEEATDAYLVAEEIKAAGVKVLISAPSGNATLQYSNADGAELRLSTLKVLADAEVPFAIHTGSAMGSMHLIHEAMFAIRNGLTKEQALAAVTTVPAEILGVDDRVGSLTAGLDADFILWRGDPFAPTTTAETVYINGQEIEK